MKLHHRTTQSGMTLIETVIAVAILTMAITGPMVLAYQSIKASRDARNELIATHLASEGIEAVANIRSNNSAKDPSLSGDRWLDNIIPNCTTGCVFDITERDLTNVKVWKATALSSCPLGNCTAVSRMYYNNATGLYRQNGIVGSLGSGWQASPFRRVIQVTQLGATPYQAQVDATVYFNRASGGEGKVTLSEELFNWFPEIN